MKVGITTITVSLAIMLHDINYTNYTRYTTKDQITGQCGFMYNIDQIKSDEAYPGTLIYIYKI